MKAIFSQECLENVLRGLDTLISANAEKRLLQEEEEEEEEVMMMIVMTKHSKSTYCPIDFSVPQACLKSDDFGAKIAPPEIGHDNDWKLFQNRAEQFFWFPTAISLDKLAARLKSHPRQGMSRGWP